MSHFWLFEADDKDWRYIITRISKAGGQAVCKEGRRARQIVDYKGSLLGFPENSSGN